MQELPHAAHTFLQPLQGIGIRNPHMPLRQICSEIQTRCNRHTRPLQHLQTEGLAVGGETAAICQFGWRVFLRRRR